MLETTKQRDYRIRQQAASMFCSKMKRLANKLEEEATNIHAEEPSTARRGAEYALRIMAEHIREQEEGAAGEYELCTKCYAPLETRWVKSRTTGMDLPVLRCPKCNPLKSEHGDSHHCRDCNTELDARGSCPMCTDASRHDL